MLDDSEARNKAIDAYYAAPSNLSGREYVNIVIDAYLGYMKLLKRNKHPYNPEMVEKIKNTAAEKPVACFKSAEEANKWLNDITAQK